MRTTVNEYLKLRRATGVTLAAYLVQMIDHLRLAKGWTKARLANEVGIDTASLSQILRGVRPFSFDMAERLLTVLDE
jgi:transcriptional regulator with XRE-family HTH domain